MIQSNSTIQHLLMGKKYLSVKKNVTQASMRLAPRLDEDLLKNIDEVQDTLMASKTYVIKFLLRKGYEAWKKESKS